MTTTPASTYRDAIDTIVAQVKAEIGVDIALRVVPETIGCYAELHDYVDANNYADTIVARLELTRPWSEFINDVTDQVDVWLRAGRPADVTACQTGSSWHESTPIHCGEHAETLPPATVAARAAAAADFADLPTVYADHANPNGNYRVEVRAGFYGTQEQAEIYAQQLANRCSGEVTAIFDIDNDYEEL
ncbi:hypothetical protein [Nocardia salmonicida]|uniref:hypothetical protein n=1 Tax=Nocardia salmonicida TaxID=53431 RepID=UPI0007A39740|nr:hypothetical protein [Nocardia salmonicida]